MMEDKLDFLVYCIESFKNAKGLKGKEAIELFNKHRVFEYINASYEALHITGKEYIIDDLNIYINARQQVDSGVVCNN
jgi:hypothetical protein